MAEHPIEGMMGVTMEQPSSPFPELPLALPPAALMLEQKPTSRCLAAAPARAFPLHPSRFW